MQGDGRTHPVDTGSSLAGGQATLTSCMETWGGCPPTKHMCQHGKTQCCHPLALPDDVTEALHVCETHNLKCTRI